MKGKRIFTCLLSVLLCLGTLFSTACNNTQSSGNGGTGNAESTYDLSHTVHGGKAEATSEKIVQNGKTDYVLLKSANATGLESSALATFRVFFAEATGVNLPVVEDTAFTWSENAKVISFGENAAQQAAGVSFSARELTESGFIIKSVGKSVFCCGGSYGITYSAYELLKYYFGFEYYAPECYDLQTGVRNLAFYDFDVKEKPDIEYRSTSVGLTEYTTDPYYKDGLRVTGSSQVVGYNNHPWHNTFDYVPFEEYGETHRNWYADGVGNLPEQLCYTRDPDGFVPIVVEKMKELIVNNPTKTIVSFVQQDCGAFCICDSCMELQKKYGTDAGKAAGMLLFLNKVAKEIDEWVNSPEDPANGRNIRVMGMAYLDTSTPPVKYNEKTGEYEPMDKELVCHSNVTMVLAQVGDKYLSWEEEPNKGVYDSVRGWSAICNELMFWTYTQMHFGNYTFFSDTYNAMQTNWKLMVESHGVWLYNQGQYNAENHTAFEIMRGYLASKLSYNCQIDFDACMDNFFKAYFGPAEKPMREMFECMRARMAYIYANGMGGTGVYDYTVEKLFPYALLKQLEGYCEAGYQAIESLKTTDPEKYEAYYNRILLESLCPRITILQRHSSKFTKSELLEAQLQFKKDADSLRVFRYAESKSMEQIYQQWGII